MIHIAGSRENMRKITVVVRSVEEEVRKLRLIYIHLWHLVIYSRLPCSVG